jgi:aspartyl protease family protein
MRKSYILFLSFIGITILLLGFLVWRFPYVLDSSDNLGHLVWAVLLLCALVPGAIFHFGAAPALKYAAAWAGIFLVLLVGYSYFEELDGIAEKVKGNLFPFTPTQNANGSVSFLRANDGHFLIEASVNHVPIQFMVDTGATKIALTMADAKRLGINVESLSFNEPIQTANGLTFSAPIHLEEIRIGTIVVHDISASVTKNLADHSLLGMSFLKKLKGFKIEGNHLTLDAPPS